MSRRDNPFPASSDLPALAALAAKDASFRFARAVGVVLDAEENIEEAFAVAAKTLAVFGVRGRARASTPSANSCSPCERPRATYLRLARADFPVLAAVRGQEAHLDADQAPGHYRVQVLHGATARKAIDDALAASGWLPSAPLPASAVRATCPGRR